LAVRDPGGTSLGDRLRKILLDSAESEICPVAELLLYCASRAQLVADVIAPALAAGQVVLADRFTLSTLAYQGAARKLAPADLEQAARIGAGGIEPDHVILLDVPAEIGLARAGGKDRMEARGLAFHEEVRQRYLSLVAALPTGRASVIDAAQPREAVERRMLELVDGLVV